MSYAKQPDMDVAILGAGISGICAAYYLKYDDSKNLSGTRNANSLRTGCEEINFTIFERRETLGGTWDLFKYPGIRSDAEMVNFSFPFNPWKKKQRYGTGEDILAYLKETVETYVLDKHIKYNSDIKKVSWSDEDGFWTITIENTITGATSSVTAQFVVFGTGYYSYTEPHWPEFADQNKFQGEIVHPQFWDPAKIDYENKNVIVIGSGATAISVVPHVAQKAKLVTMLQRSPTYIVPFPRTQWTTNLLVDYILKFCPSFVYYWIALMMRWYANLLSVVMFFIVRTFRGTAKSNVLGTVKETLGAEFAHLMPHFTPRYGVWDQRVCVDTDADLFNAIKSKKATIETATIERFTKNGIVVKGLLGDEKDKEKTLAADIVVVATGLKLMSRGGALLDVNGKNIRMTDCYYYRGCMFKDIPNLFSVFGYLNASWFNKALLIAEYAQRVISHCKKNKIRVVTPRAHNAAEIESEPLVTFMDSGYLVRGKDEMPQQGKTWPWKMYQNYVLDYFLIKWASLNDSRLEYKKQ